MIIATLVLLGAAAALPPLFSLRVFPAWLSPVVALTAAGAAGIVSSYTHHVHGFALGATAVLAAGAAAVGGLGLAPAAFRIARRQSDAGEQAATGPLRGGRIIGVLERVAVAVAILAGWPEGIAIVLAVKGLARYPELREPNASEQFIIGTFASVLWAIAVGGIGRGMFV